MGIKKLFKKAKNKAIDEGAKVAKKESPKLIDKAAKKAKDA